MKECLLLTPTQLADLIAGGWTQVSGPHETEAECLAVCEDEEEPQWFCMEAPEVPEECPDWSTFPEFEINISTLGNGTCSSCGVDLNGAYDLEEGLPGSWGMDPADWIAWDCDPENDVELRVTTSEPCIATLGIYSGGSLYAYYTCDFADWDGSTALAFTHVAGNALCDWASATIVGKPTIPE